MNSELLSIPVVNTVERRCLAQKEKKQMLLCSQQAVSDLLKTILQQGLDVASSSLTWKMEEDSSRIRHYYLQARKNSNKEKIFRTSQYANSIICDNTLWILLLNNDSTSLSAHPDFKQTFNHHWQAYENLILMKSPSSNRLRVEHKISC